MPSDTRPTVFCTATNRIIDVVYPNETHAAALTRLAEYGTALTVVALEEAAARYENAFKSDPVAITQERFHEMLEVLPPHDWRSTAAGESFKLIERTAGTVTGIYVRMGTRYFELSDSILLTHDAIIARVQVSSAYRDIQQHDHENG